MAALIIMFFVVGMFREWTRVALSSGRLAPEIGRIFLNMSLRRAVVEPGCRGHDAKEPPNESNSDGYVVAQTALFWRNSAKMLI